MYVCMNVCMYVRTCSTSEEQQIDRREVTERKQCIHRYITHIHTHTYTEVIGSTFDNDPSIALFGSLSCKIGIDMRCGIDKKQEQEQ